MSLLMLDPFDECSITLLVSYNQQQAGVLEPLFAVGRCRLDALRIVCGRLIPATGRCRTARPIQRWPSFRLISSSLAYARSHLASSRIMVLRGDCQ